MVCVCVCVSVCVCVFPRDLIKVLKWYVDRIVDAEHQDHIQQVLKVRRLESLKQTEIFLSRTLLHAAVSADAESSGAHTLHSQHRCIQKHKQTNLTLLSAPPRLIYPHTSSECVTTPFIIPFLCLLRRLQF